MAVPPSVDMELFDQGKQTKFVHAPEWLRPLKSPVYAPEIIEWGDNGVIEMGNGGEVPGVAGQGACEQGSLVVCLGDNHLDDPQG